MAPLEQFKIVIVGDAKVGKSCLLSLYANDTNRRHMDTYIPTTGVDFTPKSENIDGDMYNLHFCDVEGSSRTKSTSTAPPYFKGAHGVIIVFDVTNRESYENVTKIWLKDVDKFTDKKTIQKLLIANKCDLQRTIDEDDVQDLAKDEDIPVFETSALKGTKVDDAFLSIAKAIRVQFHPKEGDKKPEKSKTCLLL